MADGPSPRPRLTRDRDRGVLGGVCAGLALHLGVDILLVRVAFVVAAIASAGAMVAAYVLAWIFMAPGGAPRPEEQGGGRSRLARVPMGNWRVAAGVGFLTLAVLLLLREAGLWWSDALAWPAILAAAGAALLWRQSRATVPPDAALRPAGEILSEAAGPAAAPRRSGIADVYRGGFGVALVLGAGLLFLYANGVLGDARDVVLAVVVAALALGLILAPFLWRLGQSLAAERAERIRSQERSELAAHLHDSVLQTLTLVQKRAGDPRAVAQLARRQERELRSWLFESERTDAGSSLAAALRRAAAEVEDAHGVPVDVVAVGDAPRSERGDALVGAAREAMVNAAKFAPEAGPVAVYAELSEERAQVFVRDRGPGFDQTALPPDRRGLRESIIGRMERFGGTARVRSQTGQGTEVELAIELEQRR